MPYWNTELWPNISVVWKPVHGDGVIRAGWLDSRSVSHAIWRASTHLECNVTHQQRAPGRQDTHRCTWESVCWFVEQEDTCSYSRHFHLSLHTSWYLFTLKINIKAATAIKHLNSFINISATEPLHWKRGKHRSYQRAEWAHGRLWYPVGHSGCLLVSPRRSR